MTLRQPIAAVALAMASLALAAADPAAAGGRHRGPGAHGEDVVHAASRHGNGSVSGPVRPSRFGAEVRLPGGTWVECRRSCSETLRVEALDMWENDGRLKGVGTVDLECGIFGCLDLHYPR